MWANFVDSSVENFAKLCMPGPLFKSNRKNETGRGQNSGRFLGNAWFKPNLANKQLHWEWWKPVVWKGHRTDFFLKVSAILIISRVKRHCTRVNLIWLIWTYWSLFRTASGQRTFQYRATSLWNELQPALKLSPSVTEYKCLLRQKLFNDYCI